jgi:hypothetical protein
LVSKLMRFLRIAGFSFDFRRFNAFWPHKKKGSHLAVLQRCNSKGVPPFKKKRFVSKHNTEQTWHRLVATVPYRKLFRQRLCVDWAPAQANSLLSLIHLPTVDKFRCVLF